MVQWLRLCALNVGGLGLIPGQGIRSHVSQPTPSAAKLINLKKFFKDTDGNNVNYKPWILYLPAIVSK